MASLLNRVTSFGRSSKGQGLIRQAMSRFGGGDARTGRRSTGRRNSARRSPPRARGRRQR